MRSIHPRFVVALVVALVLATAPVSFDAGGRGDAAAPSFLVRLVSPALPAWADDDIELEDVGKVKRGEKNVVFRADVKRSGLRCSLRIKYADGNTDTVGKTVSDRKGICEISIDLPDKKSIVGDATIKLKVQTKSGDDQGKASRNFTIRDRRGG